MTSSIEIIAHRGLCLEYPENTLTCFKAALEQGFGIEVDVRSTKDDLLVVLHDDNLERCSVNGSGKVKNYTLKDLNGIILKDAIYSNENKIIKENILKDQNLLKIPTFDDICILAKKYNHLLCVHAKEKGNIELILSSLNKHKISNALIFDLSLDDAEMVKKISKVMACPTLADVDAENYYSLLDLVDNKNAGAVWLDDWKMGLLKDGSAIKELKDSKKKIYVISPELHLLHKHEYSKNYKEIWKRLLSWKVDGICTDHPRELRDTL